MKKNIIIILMAGLTAILSCTKDRTCICTTTDKVEVTEPGGRTTTTESKPVTKTIVYTKAKKSNLVNACSDVTFTDNYAYNSASGTVRTKTTTDTKCILQ